MITTDEQLVNRQADEDEELEAALDEQQDEAKGKTSRLMFWLHVVAFVLGLALLVYVINLVGVQPIFDALGRIGFGFFLLLAISGARHALRTLAMSTAVPKNHRRFNFSQAFAVRLGGEAISFLTFTGPVLGEATKVALLKKRVPLTYGVTALVIDNILYNLSVVVFILSGACVMLWTYNLPPVVRYILLAIAGISAFGIFVTAYLVHRRVKVLTGIVEKLARIGIKPKAVTSRIEHLYELETKVYGFYKHRPGAFFSIIALDFLSHATSVYEVYATLRLLDFTPPVAAAYIIESLTKVINFVFGFVPATIGVYEGGTEIILQTLGFAAATGVTLALVRKAGAVFWTGLGLLILLWRTVPKATRRVMDRSPRLRKLMDSLVLSNISHRPARTLVSILGIAVGVLLIVFTVGLAHGVLRERGRRESNIGAEIMVRASGTIGMTGSQRFAMPVSRAEEIARLEGVRGAIPLGQDVQPSDSGFGSRIVDGINFDEYASVAGLSIKEGRKLEGGGDEAIVDTVWQKDRKAAIGSTVVLYERPFRIVGVYEPPGGGRIKIPLATMQDQLGSEGHASSILVACKKPEEQEQVAARIRERFPDDQILFTRDLPELYVSSVPALDVFIKVIVGIAAAISLLVILLAMYTTVTERTRQIGILKSLGMSKTTIAWVIEQEAIIVSLLGVAVGLILTFAARYAVMRSTSLIVEIEPLWLGIALLVGLLGGTLGALYPAVRAARQDAVEALSYE
ncbi:MAG TPA: ABC transporter permease [Pyrinomonadaceae bacterium]